MSQAMSNRGGYQRVSAGAGTKPGTIAAASGFTSGATVLAGLYLAISPWVVNSFPDGAGRLAMVNVILGLSVAAYGVAMSAFPLQVAKAGWAVVAIGVWEFITPWVIGPDTGATLWNNIVMGVIIGVLGLFATGLFAQQMMTGGNNTSASSGTYTQ